MLVTPGKLGQARLQRRQEQVRGDGRRRHQIRLKGDGRRHAGLQRRLHLVERRVHVKACSPAPPARKRSRRSRSAGRCSRQSGERSRSARRCRLNVGVPSIPPVVLTGMVAVKKVGAVGARWAMTGTSVLSIDSMRAGLWSGSTMLTGRITSRRAGSGTSSLIVGRRLLHVQLAARAAGIER